MEQKKLCGCCQVSIAQYERIKEFIEGDDVEKLSTLILLDKLMFDKNEIRQYMKSNKDEKEKLLNKKRQFLLKQAHEYYKLIDTIDDMIYKVKGE